MSLVPFEKPRPEDQLPDPFESQGMASHAGAGSAAAVAQPGEDRGAHGGAPISRPWALPRPVDAPDPPLRRLPPPVERDRVLPFRSRSRVPIRRRTPWRRWLRPLLGALAIVGGPVALVLWFLTSSHFALSDWRITTGERVDATWVGAQLSTFAGRNLFELDLRQVEERLAHPWVAGVDLRKEFPDRLVVRVIERREVALWRSAEGLAYVDGAGRIIAPYRVEEAPTTGVDLVLLSRREDAEGGADAAARRAAVALLREIEDLDSRLLSGLAEIEVLGEDDFQIFTSDLPFPLLVRAGTLEAKTRRLEEILPGLMARHGVPAAVDLRFRRRIIVEPSEPLQARSGAAVWNR